MGTPGRVDLSLRKRNLERGNKEEEGNVIFGEKGKEIGLFPMELLLDMAPRHC